VCVCVCVCVCVMAWQLCVCGSIVRCRAKVATFAAEAAASAAKAAGSPSGKATVPKSASAAVTQPRTEQLLQQIRSVDVCLTVGLSSSIVPHFTALRDKLALLSEAVQRAQPHVVIRWAFIGYRDYDAPSEQRFECVPFTFEVKTVRDRMQKLLGTDPPLTPATGDFPEDVMGGFKQALSLEWKSDARIMIHMGDRPPHGSDFQHAAGEDLYADGDPDGESPETLV